ncbi:DivIVA domain-containing protein [Arthrobacter stackebrandtii]|uniref:DivIVA domain-containing protein n=1 Tax=Arthrobacter stackebrandtii TaxID=272161 RepID=A0ABS4YXL6_9MICC|nr:DivIVA domain-containing protein [Arthrobacter stackebrandtii]PYH00617.1 hypothetical protein CVV67_08815 [Arthrobacter stackebrandtii]
MTYFLIFLAIIVGAAAVFYVVGLNRLDADATVYEDALGAPVASLPPVLLPAAPAPADVDRLRFSLGLRGYRMDQVDEVLDRLRDELALKDAEIARLESAARPDSALPAPVSAARVAASPTTAAPVAKAPVPAALKHDGGAPAAAGPDGSAGAGVETGPDGGR